MDVKINSRKILAALAEICGGADKMIPITIAIDKLDKIGMEKVKEELRQNNLSGNQISMIENYLQITGSNDEKLDKIGILLGNVENGKSGIEELRSIFDYIKESGNQSETGEVTIDFTLARGLNYYTGIIYEVKGKEYGYGKYRWRRKI